MRISILKLLLVFFIVSSTFGGAILVSFNVTAESDDAVVEWKTSQEINIKNFIVERQGVNTPFTELQTFQPKGDNSTYTFRDRAIYKSNDVLFTYHIKIVDMDGGITYSNDLHVPFNISSVKRTWGSIKAMFR